MKENKQAKFNISGTQREVVVVVVMMMMMVLMKKKKMMMMIRMAVEALATRNVVLNRT